MNRALWLLSVLAVAADYRAPGKGPATGVAFRHDGTGVVLGVKPPLA